MYEIDPDDDDDDDDIFAGNYLSILDNSDNDGQTDRETVVDNANNEEYNGGKLLSISDIASSKSALDTASDELDVASSELDETEEDFCKQLELLEDSISFFTSRPQENDDDRSLYIRDMFY